VVPAAARADSYQAGKPSALVVDCGAGLTSVTPVNDGYVLKNSTPGLTRTARRGPRSSLRRLRPAAARGAPGSFRQQYAGNAVSDFTLAYLEEAMKIKVNPRYLVAERKGAPARDDRGPLAAPSTGAVHGAGPRRRAAAAVEVGKPFNPRLRDLGKTTASYNAAMRRVRARRPRRTGARGPRADRAARRTARWRCDQAVAADFKEGIVQVTAGSFQDDEACADAARRVPRGGTARPSAR